jgi:hypothetical protein
MPARNPRRFELEVRFDEHPIRGRISEREMDRHWGRSFAGWIGLLSAIEAASGAEGVRRADPARGAKSGEDD